MNNTNNIDYMNNNTNITDNIDYKLEITYEVDMLSNENQTFNSAYDIIGEPTMHIEKRYVDFDYSQVDKLFDNNGNLYLEYLSQYNDMQYTKQCSKKYSAIMGNLKKMYNFKDEFKRDILNKFNYKNWDEYINKQQYNMDCKEYIWSGFANESNINTKNIEREKKIEREKIEGENIKININ